MAQQGSLKQKQKQMDEFKIIISPEKGEQINELSIHKTNGYTSIETYNENHSVYTDIRIEKHHAEHIIETLKKLFNI